MKELVMTIEMKEVDVMNPQMAGDVGYAFANMADMLMNVRMQMYAPPMTFDEYVDEQHSLGYLIDQDGFIEGFRLGTAVFLAAIDAPDLDDESEDNEA